MYQTILLDFDWLSDKPRTRHHLLSDQCYRRIWDWSARQESIEGSYLQDSFGRFYGFSKEEYSNVIDYYHEYFSEKALYENEGYSGVPDLLFSLKQASKQLIVAM